MLRILDYPWHQVHLYRLATALPARFSVVGLKQPFWNTAQRPIPDNVDFITRDAVRSVPYDLALLHLDQWCDRLNLRALPYRIMKQITQHLPQVVIMHGTPDSEQNRQAILSLIGDLPVVCNSMQAATEWDGGEERVCKYGTRQFPPIIHGYRTGEFFNYPLSYRSLGAITICSGGELSREYHGLPLLGRLKRDVPITWVGPRGDKPWRPNYRSYRGLLASSLIYFSPTQRAPMPGARTEAMLSGCCVVSVLGNDVDNFIQSHVNGVLVRNYAQAYQELCYLLDYPQVAYELGQAGRRTALKAFDHRRYRDDWLQLLKELGV